LKIIFVPGQRPDYVRNSILVKGLQKNGVEVVQCGVPESGYPTRMIKTILNFISAKSSGEADAIFVGFYGQPLVPLVRSATNLPIIFDAFISTYDTLCYERRTFRNDSPLCRLFYALDKSSCKKSNVILLDTNAHIDYFVRTFGLDRDRFSRVLVGADDDVFRPTGLNPDSGKSIVFFHGTYRPVQGIDVIIKAAHALVEHDDIIFRIIGRGPEKTRITRMVSDLGLRNVELIEWVPYEELPHQIEMSSVCLGGHFSTYDKANRVIAGKTFQYMAMKRPTIVGDNPANRELLEHRKSALMVKPGDHKELADAILELREDDSLAERIGDSGHQIFLETCTPTVIGDQLRSIIEGSFGE
jgi:glycosyltransferase involved in cell wall biosynthesis